MPTLDLDTRPEPLEIDLPRTAVVVVDVQNAFASPGGMLDLAGVDISGANEVVRRVGEVLLGEPINALVQRAVAALEGPAAGQVARSLTESYRAAFLLWLATRSGNRSLRRAYQRLRKK